MAPFSWNGAEFIYERLMKPFFVKHQKKIDEYLEKAEHAASEYYEQGKKMHHSAPHLKQLLLIFIDTQ